MEPGSSRLVAAGAGSWTFKEEGGETVLTSRFTLRTENLPWWLPISLYRRQVEADTRRSFQKPRRLVLTRLEQSGPQPFPQPEQGQRHQQEPGGPHGPV